MQLTTADLRSLVIECLRKDRPRTPGGHPFQVQNLNEEIAAKAKDRGLKNAGGHDAWEEGKFVNPVLRPDLQAELWDIIWDLITEGIIRPGCDTRSFELPQIHLTSYGKESVSGAITPHDPDGYLEEIVAKVPNADPIIVKYIAESAETLRRNCMLSSTVTLGCASEKAFLLVLDACIDALNPADQATFKVKIDAQRSIKQKHAEFKKLYDSKLKSELKKSMDSDWISGFEDCLNFVFSYFRDTRNDAGHPTGTVLTRERAHAHLILFPFYLRLMYDLIQWCSSNKPI